MKHTTLESTKWALKRKVMPRAAFLAEIDAVVPRIRLPVVIEPMRKRCAPSYSSPGREGERQPLLAGASRTLTDHVASEVT